MQDLWLVLSVRAADQMDGMKRSSVMAQRDTVGVQMNLAMNSQTHASEENLIVQSQVEPAVITLELTSQASETK